MSGNLRNASRAGARILATIGRVALVPHSLASRGAVAGCIVALACLVAFAFWLATVEATSLRAGIAVWLVAWPVLLLGTMVGSGTGSLLARVHW